MFATAYSQEPQEGTVGLLLNRPMGRPLEALLEEPALQRAFGHRPLHVGGMEVVVNERTSGVWTLRAMDAARGRCLPRSEEVVPGLSIADAAEAAAAVRRCDGCADSS